MKSIRTTAILALALAIAIAAWAGRARGPLGSAGDSYLAAELGSDEITEFGPQGSRMALYDTSRDEPRRLNLQGYQLLQDRTCTLWLSIRNPQEGTTYSLGPVGGEAYGIFTSATFPKNLLRSFSTSEAHAGTIVLSRFDIQRRIAEGTFEFVARKNVQATKDPATPDSIRVMRGRFRLRIEIAGPPEESGPD